jgi:hypothetical protein
MARRRTLILTEAQRAELIDHRDHDKRPYVRERSAALLKIADGHSAHFVALQALLKPRDPDTVYGWLKAYEHRGFSGIVERRHGGYRRRHL